ncbi:MAG: tyrosine-type recombinase/integrase [bacterium]|nr:tyrosine-type recombinase/integrase [bacterium]
MSNLTLQESEQKFNDHLKQTGKAPATIIAYAKDIEQLVEFLTAQGKIEAETVTGNDLEAYKAYLTQVYRSDKTVSRKVNSVKSFFRYLNDNKLISTNPSRIVTQPQCEQTPPRVLSKTEYRALRDACRGDIRMLAIVETLLQTGMRISELASLRLSDLDFERNAINIETEDTGINRQVPMNETAKKTLQAYLKVRPRAREKVVFLTKTCKPFLVRNIRKSLDRYFRLAGLGTGIKVNDLRHTFIVEQLRAGLPMVYVSKIVGHKRLTTTEKYLAFVQLPDYDPTIKIETL